MIKMINRQLFGNDSTQSLSKENFLAGFFAALDDKLWQASTLQACM